MIDLKYVDLTDWLLIPFRIDSGTICIGEYDVVGVAVAPTSLRKVTKMVVVNWVLDTARSLFDRKDNIQVIFTSGVPRPSKETFNRINYNRNLAYGIRRWNVLHPQEYVKYCGWHKALLSLPCPEDGVWESSEMDLICESFFTGGTGTQNWENQNRNDRNRNQS